MNISRLLPLSVALLVFAANSASATTMTLVDQQNVPIAQYNEFYTFDLVATSSATTLTLSGFNSYSETIVNGMLFQKAGPITEERPDLIPDESGTWTLAPGDDPSTVSDWGQTLDFFGTDYATLSRSISTEAGGHYTFSFYINTPAVSPQSGLRVTTDAVLAPVSSPAPEPETWALLLGGFGAIGGTMRARRKSAVSFG